MASNNLVVPRGGRATLTLTAGQSIAIQSSAQYTISQINNYPQYPAQLGWLATVPGGPQTVYGPYTTGAVLQIDVSYGDDLYYEIGTNPVVQTTQRQVGNVAGGVQAVNATGTMTAANVLGDIITSSTAAAVNATLPLGTALDAASVFQVGDYLDFIVINTGGANAFTILTNTGWTLVGSMVVALGTSARFRMLKTAAGTFTLYRAA